MGSQTEHLTQFIFGKTCCIGKTIVYICLKNITLLNYDAHSHFSKNLAFYENFATCYSYLKGIFVCICMARGYQGAHAKFFERLVLSDVILV